MAFLHEFLFALGLTLLFGLCGAGALASFLPRLRYGILATPLAGLLLVPLGTNAFYVVLRLSLQESAIAAIVCCALVTAAQYKALVRHASQLAFTAIILIVTIAFLVMTVDAATIAANGPALLYRDGTDQAGYAHLADWLLANHVSVKPVASPDLPYQSWPALLISVDPRFGCFTLLAVIAWLHGTTAVFAYDIACTIVLACGTLGVAAIFARNAALYIVLLIGLLTSHWFDYSRLGFFGKLCSYPAALFLAGLVLTSFKEISTERLFFLVFLTAGAAIMHSGTVLSVLLAGLFGGAFVFSLPSLRKSFRDFLLVCGTVTLLPSVAAGVLARPLPLNVPDWDVSWLYAVTRLLDLDNQGTYITGLASGTMGFLVAISFILWAAFLIWAVRTQDIPALGMIGGPAIMLAVLAARGATGVRSK